jgi:hypothetical protein
MDQRIVIAQLNIDHLRWQLAAETDDAQRQKLLRLLADQEAKLAALKADQLPKT